MAKILIVDDEESICWGLARLCSQIGFDAVTAASAEAGIEQAKAAAFDVVVLDVRLPGMDGITAIELFHEVLGKVPVVTITAFGDLQTAIEAIQRGAFEYI
ncbi:MAG: response regulator, partial [Planctomycetota bacterium]